MADKLIFAEVTKVDDTEDGLFVEGYATTEAIDLIGEIVDMDAISDALDDYAKWANVREMHDRKAVGVTREMRIDSKGLFVRVEVVDEKAKDKVRKGVLKAFSIGFKPIKKVWDSAREALRVTKLILYEISLCDRPMNPDTSFIVVKRDITNQSQGGIEMSEKEKDKGILETLGLKKVAEDQNKMADIADELKTVKGELANVTKERDEFKAAMETAKTEKRETAITEFKTLIAEVEGEKTEKDGWVKTFGILYDNDPALAANYSKDLIEETPESDLAGKSITGTPALPGDDADPIEVIQKLADDKYKGDFKAAFNAYYAERKQKADALRADHIV